MNSHIPKSALTPEARAMAANRGRRPNPYRHAERPGVPLMLTVSEAAETLRTTPDALRTRMRRAMVTQPDGSVTAPLAFGIVGPKMGVNTWRNPLRSDLRRPPSHGREHFDVSRRTSGPRTLGNCLVRVASD